MEKVNEKKSVNPIRARINALESEILQLKKLYCESRNRECRLLSCLSDLLSIFNCENVYSCLSAEQIYTIAVCTLQSLID